MFLLRCLPNITRGEVGAKSKGEKRDGRLVGDNSVWLFTKLWRLDAIFTTDVMGAYDGRGHLRGVCCCQKCGGWWYCCGRSGRSWGNNIMVGFDVWSSKD